MASQNLRPLTDDEREHVEQHTALAYSVARLLRASHPSMPFDEILSCCHEGMIYAARTWDAEIAGWSTHAAIWMRSIVRREMGRRRLIHIPAHVREGRPGSEKLLEAAERVTGATRLQVADHHLPVDDRVEEAVERDEEIRRVRRAIDILPEPHRTIVLRSTLGDESLDAIARDYVFSKEMVRKYKVNGIQKLRRMLAG